MTTEQLHQIDQARRYAEQDEYVVTRTHIRNLLAIIERQQAEAVANSATVCNVFEAFGEHYDDSLSPAENVRRMIRQQAASVPEGYEIVHSGEIAHLRRNFATQIGCERGEVHYWQGDGQDFPDSLACPVVMHANTLREMLAAATGESKRAASVPDGWKITKMDALFDAIEVVSPDGFAAIVCATSRNPSIVLYKLARAMLAAAPEAPKS